MIVILFGGSAAGKSFIVKNILPTLDPDFQVVPKYISRDARPDEINDDGSLKDSTIIPSTPKEDIEKLDYHYATERNGTAGYYGFSKSTINDLLAKGKIPIINKCDESTYMQLLRDYPNEILSIYVDHCDHDPSIISAIMQNQGRTEEERSQRYAETDPSEDFYWKNPNSIAIFNPAYPRQFEQYSKPLAPFVYMQLINIFKSIYEEKDEEKYKLFSGAEKNLSSTLREDKELTNLYHKLTRYFNNMSININKSHRIAHVSDEKVKWWLFVAEEMRKHNHCQIFFDPGIWNIDADRYGLPKVPLPEQKPEQKPESHVPGNEMIDSFDNDRGMD